MVHAVSDAPRRRWTSTAWSNLVLSLTVITLAGCSGTAEIADLPPSAEPSAATPSTMVDLAHSIIPAPSSASFTPGERFTITPETPIVVEAGNAEALRMGQLLASLVGNTVETTPQVVEGDGAVPAGSIHLTTRGARGALGGEGYELVIAADGVTLTAPTAAGLFYGVQTLRHLLPPAVEYTAAFPQPMWVPAGRIDDAPRFAWRGAMLDVSRHFLAPEGVKRYIDLMALYKLNRLHLHLSDDQGWRIEIPGRPNLTTHGARTAVGGGPGGFYTTAEYTDLVRYAAERFITLVPEIDLPGHINAALASYPEITCDGIAPELYTGTSVGFSYVCVEKEETYAFIEDVVREISALTPGPYFHLGGDEVHELTAAQYAQFMERAQPIVTAHGKRVVGWDEIAEVDLVPEAVIQVWRPQSAGTAASVAAAVAGGASVILSPADRVYLDMKYDTTTVLGLHWAGYNDVRDAYDWEPTALVPGVPEAAILGVEAPLWSETLSEIADFEYMAFPRLAGVAEIGWSPSGRTWSEYRQRLGAQAPRWTALGVNFHRAPEVPWR